MKSSNSKIAVAAVAGLLGVGALVQSSSSVTEQDALPPDCNPNYQPCVPVATDVDCADGEGNGPEYVRGPVRVTGDDVYNLDRDGDGIACER